MRHAIHLLLAACLFSALAGCQQAPRQLAEKPPKPAIAIPGPGAGQFVKEIEREHCNKFADCKSATVFPDYPLAKPAGGNKGCKVAKVTARSGGLSPRNVDPQTRAKVWVAMIVPASGGNPIAGRVVGSEDERFDASAYAMAMAMAFQPKTCKGVAYDAYVVAPFFFGPRPLLRQ